METDFLSSELSWRSALMALISDDGSQLEADVVFDEATGLALDIYEPESGGADPTTVVFFFAGSWTSGDKGLYRFLGAALASRGIRVVIPNYRLYPDVAFPAFIEDCAKAYAWCRGRFSDAGKIAVMGHSAGAYNAAFLAYDRRWSKGMGVAPPDALIGLAGPYAFDPLTWEPTRPIFSTVTTSDEARPVAYVDDAAPVSFLLHGDDDQMVQPWNTRELRKAMLGVDRPVTMTLYDGIGHVGLVTSIARPLRWRASTLDDIVSFIRHL